MDDWEQQILGLYYLSGAADPKAECLKNVDNTLVSVTTDKGWYVEKNDYNTETKSLYIDIRRPMTIDNLETLNLEEDTEYYYTLNGGVFPSKSDETPELMYGDVANVDQKFKLLNGANFIKNVGLAAAVSAVAALSLF